MALFEFIKDRKRKAVLFFLTGFFSGGILYFLCKDAAADLYEDCLLYTSPSPRD